MATPLEQIISDHQEVIRTIEQRSKRPGTIPEAQWNRWDVVLAIFTRSSNYARAAKLLLDNEYWEAAGALTRTIFEDAAVLAYIESREKQAEDFARLYLKSAAFERYRVCKRFEQLHVVAAADDNLTEDDLEEQKNEFCALRAKLWYGDRKENDQPKYSNPRAWNGLSMEDTLAQGRFEQSGRAGLYGLYYVPLCTFVHSSALALSCGFQSQLELDGSIDLSNERNGALRVVDGLIVSLYAQLIPAKGLIEVTPKSGMPDFEALLEQVRATE